MFVDTHALSYTLSCSLSFCVVGALWENVLLEKVGGSFSNNWGHRGVGIDFLIYRRTAKDERQQKLISS